MPRDASSKFIVCGCVIFLILLSFCLVQYTEYTLAGLLFISLVIIAFYFSFINIGWLFVVLIFSIPLSVNMEILHSGTNIMLPSELFTGMLAMTFFFHLLLHQRIDGKFLSHPITLLIILFFILYALSACFSSMPFVSLKAVFVRFCYFVVFYFFIHIYIKKEISNIRRIYELYGAALAVVVLLTLFKHSEFGFIKNRVNTVVQPFYADHTIYSACLAFILPAFLASFFFAGELGLNIYRKILSFIMVSVFITGLFYSYSRGAWVSIAGASCFLIVLLFKIRFRYLILVLLGGFIGLIIYSDNVSQYFISNKYDSNARNAGISEQAKSILDISNDQSNMERLNRWKCALRMFGARPLTGFGPGTYQFQFLPFQRKSEMTHISVITPWNIPAGRGGTAHSEYLLLLSESGILTFLVFLLLIMAVIYYGLKNNSQAKNKRQKILSAVALLGFVTYSIHGLFNNFLDTDKVAFLFWSSISILVTIDTCSEQEENLDTKKKLIIK